MATSYYRPYLPSDSENSDADTTSTSSTPTSSTPDSPRPENAGPDIQIPENTGPDFAALAAALKGPFLAAGPNFDTITENDAYAINQVGNNVYGPYPIAVASGQPIPMKSTDSNSIISLESIYRDPRIFLQPTDCWLRLPKTYCNITGFSITQITLTSSFFYFNTVKNNVSLQIYEQDRVVYTPTIPTLPVLDISSATIPLEPVNTIRTGSYNIDTLMTELETQLNRTPVFFDFINGFSDFLTIFPISGDLSLNFNEPGDNYYDALNKKYIFNPTREIITSYYFKARYELETSFTIQQIRVAYYYPVLKELLLDADTVINGNIVKWTTISIDFTQLDASGNQIDFYNYILYYFKGIDDVVIQTYLAENTMVSQLDTFRIYHTFRYSLVNKYSCTVNPANSRITFQATGLNTSLSNYLVNKYNSILTQQISLNALTPTEYANLTNVIITNRAIYQDMYTMLQTMFARYFAVDYGTYSGEYYVNSNNTFILRQGINAQGVNYTYNPAVTPAPRTTDILNDYKALPPSYWPYMTNIPGRQGPATNMGKYTDIFPVSSNYPYSLSFSNIDFTRNFIDSNGYIYTDYRRKCGDILVNVEASKYTIFKFRSKYRQSLQVETLPRQTAFRYPIWNQDPANRVDYPLSNLFDVSYCYVAPDPNTTQGYAMLHRDISFNAVYGWSNDIDNNPSANFGTSFNTSSNYWAGFQEQINIANIYGRVYSVTAPYVNNTSSSNINKYLLNFTFISSNAFETDFLGFLYHDIAALAADVSPVGRLKENPVLYKDKFTIPANSFSNTFTVNVYAGQTYYTLFRPSVTNPPATFYQVIPWMSNSYFSTLTLTNTIIPTVDPRSQISNYYAAIEADPDFIRLPIVSTLWASNTPANTLLNLELNTYITPIGYDTSGVSTDMTDYIPFAPYNLFSTINPTAITRVDPTTNFVFQYNTPYDAAANTYFGTGSKNTIYTESAVSQYTPKTVTSRDYKFVNYYNTAFIRDTGNLSYEPTSVNSNVPPYNIATTGTALGGYTYSTDSSLGNPIQLGDGVSGFTFLPSDGRWEVDRLTYKTNFTNPSDPGNGNNNVHCLGIYFTSDIYTIPLSNVRLSNAVRVMLRVSEKTYTPNSQNIGFDSVYGTYYTFSNFPALSLRSNVTISGFTQAPGQLITDLSSYYSIIAFTLSDFLDTWTYSTPSQVTLNNLSNTVVTTMQNIVGSPIPYPYGCAVSTSSVFYDGQPSPLGWDMVVASAPFSNTVYGPTVNYGEPVQSVSQYEQSLPYVNSHIHYGLPQNIISDPSGFSAWSSLPINPDYIHTSVCNRIEHIDPNNASTRWFDGYMLFQGNTFSLASYKIYTTTNNLTDADRNFTFMHQISLQQIYPDNEQTALVAVSGNTSNFVFLGVREDDLQLRFKLYDPTTGVLTELPINPTYKFNQGYNLQKFVYNNSNGWYYTAKVANTTTVTLQGTPRYSYSGTDGFYAQWSYTGSNTELQMPPDGQNVYFAYYTTNGFSNMNLYPIDPTNSKSVTSSPDGYTIHLDTSPVAGNPYYKQMAATLNHGVEEVFFTNIDYNSRRYYKLRNYLPAGTYTSNTNIDQAIQQFKDPSGNFISTKRIMGGANGSKWAMSDSFPYVLGNRNDPYDSPTSIGIAWQIFFPTVKIQMKKIGNNSTPILDLTSLTYPEWPHTCMFSYSNYDSMIMDISNNWGLERNFTASDVSFNGFYFNSYLLNVPLHDTSQLPATDSNAYTYVAVRGYLPTESFQAMMRFNLPGRYDFGFITITDLITEYPLTQTIGYQFNPNYRETLIQFNSNFIFTNRNFGASSTQALPGSNITSTGFSDFMTQYVAAYSNFSTNSVKVQIIQSTLTADMNSYISNNMQYILPASALTRSRFTDPLLFQVLWQSYLTPTYSVLDDNWGLGWNLGFLKLDTAMSTYQTAQSFYKIQDEYIYLRLNQELNINGMDVGSNENYSITREPTGATHQYYCKLLLTTFGGNATTFIHNPIIFTPPLNSLTNLHFQWLDKNGAVIDNNDCEWSMIVNVTEHYEIPVLPINMPFTPMSESDMSPAKNPFDSQ